MATTQFASSVIIHEFPPNEDGLLTEILQGLQQPHKVLPSKLFYDERGSQLFEQICDLEEYYPTRTELAIMSKYIEDVTALLGPNCLLVEYGSGSSRKTHLLLECLPDLVGYIPIDVSRTQLAASAQHIRAVFPQITVLPVWADYTKDLTLPTVSKFHHKIAYYPGSTIGNFHPDEALSFLKRIANALGHGGGLLIGVDLRKNPQTLDRAYNDAAGITAQFNLNILTHINREFGGTFNEGAFTHHALYQPQFGRIEMHLVSLYAQTVTVGEIPIRFREGESILTEVSYKYTVEEFAVLAARAGFGFCHLWTDPAALFSVQYYTVL